VWYGHFLSQCVKKLKSFSYPVNCAGFDDISQKTNTMKDLCVIFEEWYLGDGTYPPLHRGQKVNLSFYTFTKDIQVADKQPTYLKQIKDADYSFCGQVIRTYKQDDAQLVIVDVGALKFYMEIRKDSLSLSIGQFICGSGPILIDYYAWVEYLSSYEDPPELFYNFSVSKIRKVKIPEKFIYRNDKGMSHPTSLSSPDYSLNDIVEIENMADDDGSTSFYLLDLKAIDEPISKTFLLTII
jgi:hypothetical protein